MPRSFKLVDILKPFVVVKRMPLSITASLFPPLFEIRLDSEVISFQKRVEIWNWSFVYIVSLFHFYFLHKDVYIYDVNGLLFE